MIKITNENEPSGGIQFKERDYIKKRFFLGRIILPITRHLRATNAERYMNRAHRHLDIGCGDGYFLKRSRCDERFGLDRLYGDEIDDRLDFPDAYFDYVTLLAVIEHFNHPEKILREIFRILKPAGRCILTTPKERAERFIAMYVKDIDDAHEMYFTYDSLKKLAGPDFELVGYRTFLFGLNQVFCLQKQES